ncbi:retrovirus-related Pol polyprotein from transposon 412 [Trichonephila clavipes]|nr:retrovirus-related Pol polyprotein from transposon 412 [Trichonephila clavipes]
MKRIPTAPLKAQLIQRTGESSQQEIRKLLTGEELGDRKPSELLRTMNRRAASHNVPEELMLELFFSSCRPQRTQNEEIVLAHEIVPEIDHFHVPGNLVVGITKSFKNELRNAFHHAAIKKKTNPARVNTTTFSQPHISRRLFIKDKSSNTAFLIDTGSDVSVLPASLSEKRKGNSIQQLSAANTSPINVYGIRNKKRPKRKVKIKPEEALEWTDEATTAFELVKQALAHATLLHHPMPNAPLSIWVDASDFAVGGALAQFHDNVWQPLAFLSMKLSASQKNWSTYDRELLAIYTMKADKCSPRQLRHLDFISQFSTNIQHVPGTQNLVADALSRIEIDSISQASCLDYKDIAAAQLDYRKIVFQHLHGLSHPGIAASTKLATQRFVWPNIRRDIKTWVNSCHPCQRCKIYRHTKAPIGTFALPDARFSQIHVDFIGPFPPSNGQSYCLTVVDRFTRWMEVIPTADMTAETVCRALLSVWISRFGCPAIITTDQGTNFESSLFRELSNILGTNRIRCCAYHPKANGLVERLHRHLKSAIKAHENSKIDSVQPPLSQNYTGPHKVIRRTDKVFTILINGKRKTVSIDRVKPAYVWDDTDDIPLTGISKQQTDETNHHSKDKTMSHINKTEPQPNEKNCKQD